MKRIRGGMSVPGAALTGADEEVGENWVVLDEFEGETAEVIARGTRIVACGGDDRAALRAARARGEGDLPDEVRGGGGDDRAGRDVLPGQVTPQPSALPSW